MHARDICVVNSLMAMDKCKGCFCICKTQDFDSSSFQPQAVFIVTVLAVKQIHKRSLSVFIERVGHQLLSRVREAIVLCYARDIGNYARDIGDKNTQLLPRFWGDNIAGPTA